MDTISVSFASAAYDILIGDQLEKQVQNFLKSQDYSKVVGLIDENLLSKYCVKLDEMLGDSDRIVLEPGEANKTIKQLEHVLVKMATLEMDRRSCLIAIGGGVTGDMGGLAASLYMRGIDLIQIPTTLLSQVDSSVGGKTAVNLNGVKNLIGTFYQPKVVFIDIDFLGTLTKKEVYSGLGEIIKYGFIMSPSFIDYLFENFGLLEELNHGAIKKVISESIQFKATIVNQDEKESGLRKILNFGHTIGHGIELLGSHALSHGECVALGMVYESGIALNRGMITKEYFSSIVDLCKKAVDFYQFSDDEIYQIIELMKHDKKNEGDRINMILPDSKGSVTLIENVSINEIKNSLRSSI